MNTEVGGMSINHQAGQSHSSLHLRWTIRRSLLTFVSLMLLAGSARAQSRLQLSPAVRKFVKIDAPIVVLNHVRVIDGTGTMPHTDQAIVIQDGKIITIGDS